MNLSHAKRLVMVFVERTAPSNILIGALACLITFLDFLVRLLICISSDFSL